MQPDSDLQRDNPPPRRGGWGYLLIAVAFIGLLWLTMAFCFRAPAPGPALPEIEQPVIG
jgi:hypothetical protein